MAANLKPPQGSGGGAALPDAVSSFISLFDDTIDQASMSSFGSDATLDVPMQQPFRNKITTAANALSFNGRTFSDGGLQSGFGQVKGAPVPAGTVIKVVIFFTDGYANTFQDVFGCSPNPLNLGQGDPPFGGPTTCCGSWGFSFMNPVGGADTACSSTTFVSIDGTTKTIGSNNQNIWNEGQLRALDTATKIRAAKIIIYSIGLGGGLNQNFLRNIANDPAGNAFDPNQTQGEAVFAPDNSQLQAVFDQIAGKILLRLTK